MTGAGTGPGPDDLAAWIGRSAVATDTLQAGPVARLAATLNRDDPPLAPGEAVPPLSHWLHFLPGERLDASGPDGHPRRGGFLPPVHDLPRRMFAGSRLAFDGPLRIGDTLERVSTITAVEEKAGAAGRLVFVTLRHAIGLPGAAPAVIDEQDIVYRGPDAGPPRPPRPAEAGPWRREILPDPVLLFRYSALTFNGHRIHYDHPYVTGEEGYPGLVVHGPLLATLLLDLVRRHLPERRIARFAFRAVAATFAGNPLRVNGTPPDGSGRVRLWASNHRDELAMTAEADLD